MKRTNYSILLGFIVITTLFILTTTPQAADLVSKSWTGMWACTVTDDAGDTTAFDAGKQLVIVDINGDGSTEATTTFFNNDRGSHGWGHRVLSLTGEASNIDPYMYFRPRYEE